MLPDDQIPTRAHLDFETFSVSPLPKVGSWQYMRHPSTGATLFAYNFDKGYRMMRPEVQQLWRGPNSNGGITIGWQQAVVSPDDNKRLHQLLSLIEKGRPVTAHNAGFELDAWNECLLPEMDKRGQTWPPLRLEQLDCTMSRCNALSLPGALEDVCNVLNLPVKKDMAGAELLRSLMVANPGQTNLFTDTNLERLGDYCATDVDAEECVDKAVPPLAPDLRALWLLDQKINRRGIPFDIPRIRRAQILADIARTRANDWFSIVTLGELESVNQNTAFLEWLRQRPAVIEACLDNRPKKGAKRSIDKLITEGKANLWSVGAFELKELQEKLVASDPMAWEAIEVRLYAAKSSLAKLEAITYACGIDVDPYLHELARDGLKTYKKPGQHVPTAGETRARGQYYFMGAGPGRWTGKSVQPQNFVRFDEERDMEAAIALGYALDHINDDLEAIEYVEETVEAPFLAVLSRVIRTFIKAGSNGDQRQDEAGNPRSRP